MRTLTGDLIYWDILDNRGCGYWDIIDNLDCGHLYM